MPNSRSILEICVLTLVSFCIAIVPTCRAQNGSPETSDAPSDPESMLPHFADTRYWLSGQANFIFQTHSPFHAPYSGPNSLSPNYEKATSRLLTLYTGVRLNDSTELLVDIEEAGGSAISTGLGLAGATDLDIHAIRCSASRHI